MDKTDLESKYQKLATEYSKIRAHATVLKKAVLEEQAKALELKETIKEYEQKTRKHDQEMESLTFRNGQLTKRISVLQEELRVNNYGKKNKNKVPENMQTNFSVLDEELQKKILENAQLVSTLADKDVEVTSNNEKIEWLEDKISKLQESMCEMESRYKEDIQKLESQIEENVGKPSNVINENIGTNNSKGEFEEQISYWKKEAEKWHAEYELLHAKPESDEQLAEYYETKFCNLIEQKQIAQAEASTLWAENEAISNRLEHILLEKNALERILDTSNEELHTTSENYKQQLDAMTEHVATQNERITKLSDEIEILKHKLSLKK